jgi:serine/threonine protein kinase
MLFEIPLLSLSIFSAVDLREMPVDGVEVARVQDGRKTYIVKGVTFEIDEYYEIMQPIGVGAYGMVCSAIDLRRFPGSPFFDEALVAAEKKGGCIVKRRDGTFANASPLLPPPSPIADSQREVGAPPKLKVPTLRYEPIDTDEKGSRATAHVAIKKIHNVFSDLIDGKRILREVKALDYLRGHENVVRLIDVLHPRVPKEQFRDLYVVTELMDTDLHQVLRSQQLLTQEHMRFIMYQLVRCLVWVHSSGIIHRDIKPENLLLTDCCALKVCDFGLARGGYPLSLPPSATGRPHSPTGSEQPWIQQQYGHAAPLDLTDYVVTRYYRPPELLIMSRYNHAIDIWSTGCILGEMILGRPLFPGRDYLSQLTVILQTPGLSNVPESPEDVDACFVGGREGRCFLKDILFGQGRPGRPRDPIAALRESLSNRENGVKTHLVADTTIDFLRFLLSVDPRDRPSALEALRHPYFAKLYNSNDEIVRENGPVGVPLVPQPTDVAYESEDDTQREMWAFDQHEMTEDDLRGHFWREVKRFDRRRRRFSKR